jgi:hypothetical protein
MVRFGRTRGSGEWSEQPFWQQRGWILAAGFLLSMVALSVVAFVAGDEGGEKKPEARLSATPSAAGSPGATGQGDGRPAGCRTDDSDRTVPTETPEHVQWKNAGSLPVPTSRTAGPLAYDDPVWSCYAHTPMGAVMAAHSITSWIGYPGWREVAEKQMLPGPPRDAFLEARAKEKDKPLSAPPSAGAYAGFAVLSYTEERASVMILVEFGTEAYFSIPVDVQWHQGDWKLMLRPDGTYSPDPQVVRATDGFVTWGT